MQATLLPTIISLKKAIKKLNKQLANAQSNAEFYQHQYRHYKTLADRYARQCGPLKNRKRPKIKKKYRPKNPIITVANSTPQRVVGSSWVYTYPGNIVVTPTSPDAPF